MNSTFNTVIAALCCILGQTVSRAAEPTGPLVVAHRGLLQHSPENTLANFRACLELRMGFEFDVERSQDGYVICIHDNTVDRTTSGTGKVAELSLAKVRELDAGDWFDPRFAGEKVPTVEEVLGLIAEYRKHDVLIAVDLKAENVGADVVRLAVKHRVLDRLLFIGRTITEPNLRTQIKAASKNAHVSTVANDPTEFAQALAVDDSDWVYVRYLPSAGQVQAVHSANKRVFIAGSTVSGNLPKNWQHTINVGIDAVLTDYALEFGAQVRRSRANSSR